MIAGVVVKLWMFVLRLSHSGKAVHIAYANQAQESFLDGHVRAFAALGGVPTGMIRYDNLTPAVIRVRTEPRSSVPSFRIPFTAWTSMAARSRLPASASGWPPKIAPGLTIRTTPPSSKRSVDGKLSTVTSR